MPKVAFVLGAGASHHLGFPTGATLISDMISALSGHSRLGDAVNHIFGQGVAGRLAETIQDFSLDSIDQYMQIQSDDKLRSACRFVLTAKILEAEKASTAKMRDRESMSKNWYHLFRQFLLRNPVLASGQSFQFLSFNYDRSFEYFMNRALAGDQRISPSMVRSLLEVFHLHGSFGPLPWTQQADSVEYGGDGIFSFDAGPMGYVEGNALIKSPQKGRDVSNRIAFPHDPVSYGAQISRMLADADLVAIIGFGFSPENGRKILLDSLNKAGVPIVATAIGLSAEAREYLEDLTGVELVERRSHEFFEAVLRKRFAKIFSLN